jgi:hypothetical protein
MGFCLFIYLFYGCWVPRPIPKLGCREEGCVNTVCGYLSRLLICTPSDIRRLALNKPVSFLQLPSSLSLVGRSVSSTKSSSSDLGNSDELWTQKDLGFKLSFAIDHGRDLSPCVPVPYRN